MSTAPLARGPRPYPRIKARPEFVEHVRCWLGQHGVGMRGLARAAFAGDDSQSVVIPLYHLFDGSAFPNTLARQVRLRAVANAVGWPADEPVAVQIESD